MFNIGDRVKINSLDYKGYGTVIAYHKTTFGGGNPVVMVRVDNDNRTAHEYGIARSRV
jgi:hypothetical protein